MTDSYKYTNGNRARILCIDRIGTQDPVVSMNEVSGCFHFHKSNGDVVGTDKFNLIEVKPYDDFEIDEPVWATVEYVSSRLKRYFAGVNFDGQPLVFAGGNTAWTSKRTSTCVKVEKVLLEELT